MDQDLAKVYVAALTDAEELGLAAGRVLTRHDAEPSCELSTLAKGGSVADGSDDGRRYHWADAGDLSDARAACIRSRDPFQLIVQLFDLLFNKLPLAPEHVDQVAHLRRHSSQQETLRVREFWQLARQPGCHLSSSRPAPQREEF